MNNMENMATMSNVTKNIVTENIADVKNNVVTENITDVSLKP